MVLGGRGVYLQKKAVWKGPKSINLQQKQVYGLPTLHISSPLFLRATNPSTLRSIAMNLSIFQAGTLPLLLLAFLRVLEVCCFWWVKKNMKLRSAQRVAQSRSSQGETANSSPPMLLSSILRLFPQRPLVKMSKTLVHR